MSISFGWSSWHLPQFLFNYQDVFDYKLLTMASQIWNQQVLVGKTLRRLGAGDLPGLSTLCEAWKVSKEGWMSINTTNSWFNIPGSSRYVKFLPFGRFFCGWNGINFYTLGRSRYIKSYQITLPFFWRKVVHFNRHQARLGGFRCRRMDWCNSFMAGRCSKKGGFRNGWVAGLQV